MNRSESLRCFSQAVTMIAGGVNSPVRAFKHVGGTPVYFAKAHGSHFSDVDGNEYVDMCQSWGPLILGHAHPLVVEAVQRAAQDGLSFGACHYGEIRMAELVLSALPEFDMVRFVNSGTEAVMTALRIARGTTGRDLVVKFDGGYHGHFDGMLVKAGSGIASLAISGSKGVPQSLAETTLVAKLDDENSVADIFARYGDRIAAVIIEPLPANNGLLPQRTALLEFLRAITLQHGALLLFDEVISGFRFHFGGYYQILGIIPDMVTLGKIAGGGMPLGVIVGSEKLMSSLAPQGGVYQAGTLSGNPVALACGIATLEILQSNPPYAGIEALGQVFASQLAKAGTQVCRAQQLGSVIWLYLDSGAFPRSPDMISPDAIARFKRMYWPLLERGYYLPPSSLEVMFISSAHTEEEVTGLALAIAEIQSAMQEPEPVGEESHHA